MRFPLQRAHFALNGRLALAGLVTALCAALIALATSWPAIPTVFLAVLVGAGIHLVLVWSTYRRIGKVAAAARSGVFDPGSYRPVGDEAGDEIGVIGRAFDRLVSGAWPIESHSAESTEDRDDLEQRVDLRTRQLMEEIDTRKTVQARLEAARDLAEEANRSKSSFLANMSHEIRTPLNGLIGMAELLTTTTRLDAVQSRYCVNIQACSRALLDLINDVLDLSKIEAGKMELSSSCFDLRAEVDHVIGVLSQRAAAKALDLSHRVDPRIPRALSSDPTRIRQVLLNLIGNAVKFTDEGAVTVWVSLLSEHDDAVNVHFSIRDTGPGIDPAIADSVFDAFSQVDASTTRQHGGTGLGLAISKRIVEMLEGEIGVESVPGRGCHFWFTCRLPTVPEEMSQPIGPELNLTGLRIVNCASDPKSRHIVSEQLVHHGAAVVDAIDCDSARAVLESHALSNEPVAMVIVDSDVGEAAADALFEWMDGDARFAETSRVAIADPDQVEYYKGDMILKASATLVRPVRAIELLDALRSQLTDMPAQVEERRPRVDIAPGTRILLVEDNDINQEIVHALLTEAGFLVDVAWDGVEAMSILEKRIYDAILMDCQMPRMDGFEATRAIRAREEGVRHTPIVALTANAVRGDRERCLEVGMDDYLPKPLEPRQLIETMARWTARSGITGADSIETGNATDSSTADSTETAAIGTPTIDWAAVIGRCGGKEERALSILTRFDARLDEEWGALESAFVHYDDDRRTFIEIAHRIKGAAAMLGATEFSGTLHEIELAGRGDAERDAVATLMERIPMQIEQVHRACRALQAPAGVES